jgi:hypothetical protein
MFSPCSLHPRAVAVSVVGRSPGSRLDAFSRPSRCQRNTSGPRVLAAYSCGGSRGIGMNPHRVPFLVPPECGNRRRRHYSWQNVRRKDCGWTGLRLHCGWRLWLGSQQQMGTSKGAEPFSLIRSAFAHPALPQATSAIAYVRSTRLLGVIQHCCAFPRRPPRPCTYWLVFSPIPRPMKSKNCEGVLGVKSMAYRAQAEERRSCERRRDRADQTRRAPRSGESKPCVDNSRSQPFSKAIDGLSSESEQGMR